MTHQSNYPGWSQSQTAVVMMSDTTLDVLDVRTAAESPARHVHPMSSWSPMVKLRRKRTRQLLTWNLIHFTSSKWVQISVKFQHIWSSRDQFRMHNHLTFGLNSISPFPKCSNPQTFTLLPQSIPLPRKYFLSACPFHQF